MLAGGTVLALALTACGDDESAAGGDYCDLIQEMDESDSLSSGDMQDGATDVFHDIADAAPDDIADDWQTVIEWAEAFSEVDIDADDPESLAEVQNDEELTQLRADAEPALVNVTQHMETECDISLTE